ncbi:MAG: ribonuclease HII [Patescibacteria group bacterium]
MLNLNEEQNLFQAGYKLIGAIDEAGRGPLAGPVVAACVLISDGCTMKNKELKNIKDSKKLTAKKREELYDVILEEFDEVGIGICDQQTIDKINILQAAFLAMKKAIGSLKKKPDYIILDGGFPIPNFSLKQKNIIKGDSKVFSIATASIIAKVTRDRIMNAMHEKYPQYSFNEHKGYGTRQHLECLRMYGPCPIHRLSFKPVKILLKNLNKERT